MIGGRRPIQGRKPGDRRVRVERPHSVYFRWSGPGQLTAKQAASRPATGPGRWWAEIKASLLYNPVARRLKAVLVGREHTVIADVPYRRDH